MSDSLSQILKPRLCELGKIKIGGLEAKARQTKAGGSWRAPVKYDYFVITTLSRDADGRLIEDSELMESLIAEGYGDQRDKRLRQLPIYLLSNDVCDIMQTAYVWYVGKTCAARSDGVTLTKFVDTKTLKVLDVPETTEWKEEYAHHEYQGRQMFKVHTTFNCVIASKESRFGGVFKFRTTSGISASQLYGSLLMLKQLTGGVLTGLPLRLVVKPMQVSPGGKTTTVYVVHCEMRGPDIQAIQQRAVDIARFQLEHREEMDKVQRQMRTLLTGPGLQESQIEQSEIQEEFHPDEDSVVDASGWTEVGDESEIESAVGTPASEKQEPDTFENQTVPPTG